MEGVTWFELKWLALVAAGVFMNGLDLPGIWAVVFGGAVLQAAERGPVPWPLLGSYLGLAVACQFLPWLLPRGWQGSKQGNRQIGLGGMAGALIAGLPFLAARPVTVMSLSAAGALAGALLVEYRRRRLRLDLADEDEAEQFSLRPTALCKRVAIVWWRHALTCSLALWILRQTLMG
jgi:hypothetical protein